MPRSPSPVELSLPPGMRATRATRALVALLRSQAATRLSALAAEAGVTKIASGPKATAFTLSSTRAAQLRRRLPENGSRRWVEDRLVFDAPEDGANDDAFITSVLADLAA